MGNIVKQKPVKLVVSILFKDEDVLEEVEKVLTNKYGKLEPIKKILPFDFTDYYSNEMGKGLKRKLVTFRKLVAVYDIYKVKIFSNKIEDKYRKNGNRCINIDPGYVTEAKLVLLTTKDYTHRIHVGHNIFAESTLFFKNGKFDFWPWTYPDYADNKMSEYFDVVREIYMSDIKGIK